MMNDYWDHPEYGTLEKELEKQVATTRKWMALHDEAVEREAILSTEGRDAFEAGREYHNPGDRSPELKWKNYDDWKAGVPANHKPICHNCGETEFTVDVDENNREISRCLYCHDILKICDSVSGKQQS